MRLACMLASLLWWDPRGLCYKKLVGHEERGNLMRHKLSGERYLQWIGLILVFNSLVCSGEDSFVEEGHEEGRRVLLSSTDELVLRWMAIVVLGCMSAFFSGLTLGLLGLDKIGLQIVMSGDDADLAAKAAKIAPIREDGNLLLCTLLLGNVAVNAALSILMADLTSGVFGFIFSTIIIVVFGEIIPQAACSRYALHIGSVLVPVVSVLMFLFFPMTKPMSMLLDYWLGDEVGTIHSRTELSELLKIHVAHGAMDIEQGNVAQGAIKYEDMLVKEVMTPKEGCYMLCASDKLSFQKITEIFKSGYSRIPVFDKHKDDVIGLLLVKDLIFVDPEDQTPVRNFIQIFGRAFLLVWPDDKLGDTLRLFKKGNSHMAIVRDVVEKPGMDPSYVVAGVVTLEDILEEIIGDEIVDETDIYLDDPLVGTRLNRHEFDYDRLRLLDSGKLEYKQLHPKEAVAIGSYLSNNVKALHFDSEGNSDPFTEEDAERLLTGCPVMDLTKKSSGSVPDEEDMLFQSGKEADYMILVITGHATVLAGRNNFRSEEGPWSVLGAEALVTAEDEPFVPDFSAFITTDDLRCIRITRTDFQRAKEGHHVWVVEDRTSGVLSAKDAPSFQSKGAIFKSPGKFETNRVATFSIDMGPDPAPTAQITTARGQPLKVAMTSTDASVAKDKSARSPSEDSDSGSGLGESEPMLPAQGGIESQTSMSLRRPGSLKEPTPKSKN